MSSPISNETFTTPPVDRTEVATLITNSLAARSPAPFPKASTLAALTPTLLTHLPPHGTPPNTLTHLLTLPPAFSSPSLTPAFYAFVTGSTLPIAAAADNLATAIDCSVAVHDSRASLATTLEAHTLIMLTELLRLSPSVWGGRVITPGATGSNILAIATARDALLDRRLKARGRAETVASAGVVGACVQAGVRGMQILGAAAHSSVHKAAGVLGLGRGNVRDVGVKGEPWRLDLEKVRREAGREGWVSVVVVGMGEVNTGRYFGGEEEMAKLKGCLEECAPGAAWIHVDGAFGIFARSLPETEEFASLRAQSEGLQYADSITADCHKALNVPYASAVLLTRSETNLNNVCNNGAAAYLKTSATDPIPSPLNHGLENSRRFSALPIYAVLHAHGREGLALLFATQVRLARAVASMIRELEAYELLPTAEVAEVGTIVLFRLRDQERNEELLGRMNAQNRIYVSGTSWEGRPAVRVAVSGWEIDIEKDTSVIREVLKAAE
ncbi:hypothetical protein VC83_00606 [Pseudogymnoascus destructans]|uniref:L-2,4-diaminobutyrate decarboxylase n=1 Tax=Pseudogymnoascus destructans TaxID=655981 RepID=A0A177ANK0_9PEZI|nr:uncharacterized protein VC83_00606 [Pseudogymnoascus destructans]OAF63072.1 hypothetical protein VC83_00606 [Pseudogymnoascus destructans]